MQSLSLNPASHILLRMNHNHAQFLQQVTLLPVVDFHTVQVHFSQVELAEIGIGQVAVGDVDVVQFESVNSAAGRSGPAQLTASRLGPVNRFPTSRTSPKTPCRN